MPIKGIDQLIIHIGPGKTATSSIQKWIVLHSALLSSGNLRYLNTGLYGNTHSHLFDSIRTISSPHVYVPGQEIAPCWAILSTKIKEELSFMQERNILLSYEGFCLFNEDEVSLLLECFNPKRVVIIAAVRDPLSHTLSLWQQACKYGNHLKYSSFVEEYLDHSDSLFIPGRYLEAWRKKVDCIKIIGAGKTITNKAGDTLCQFINALHSITDIEFDLREEPGKFMENISTSWRISEIQRIMNERYSAISCEIPMPQDLSINIEVILNNYKASSAFRLLCETQLAAIVHEPRIRPELLKKLVAVCSDAPWSDMPIYDSFSSYVVALYCTSLSAALQVDPDIDSSLRERDSQINTLLIDAVLHALLFASANMYTLKNDDAQLEARINFWEWEKKLYNASFNPSSQ